MPVYRIKYSKEGPARYISHLDLLRTFARAGRRAGLPLAFTQGFNPHPKITFAAPLGVGIAGLGEFADIELTEPMSAAAVKEAFNLTLPEGLGVADARLIPDQVKSLMAMVDRATYRSEVKLSRPISQNELNESIESFLNLPEIWIERRSKKNPAAKHNIREGIFYLTGVAEGDDIILEMELKTGSGGNVKCEEVLSEFIKDSALPVEGGFSLYRAGLYQAPINQREKRTLWERP